MPYRLNGIRQSRIPSLAVAAYALELQMMFGDAETGSALHLAQQAGRNANVQMRDLAAVLADDMMVVVGMRPRAGPSAHGRGFGRLMVLDEGKEGLFFSRQAEFLQ